ncbi:MAG: undecaprenyl-phosphate glucose phosphotransferase [Rhodospirillales bacterium]|nr:undecaprenyl-phosphate glucose phosphotransferase [Rhodospirillales bacterium]
MLSKRRVVAADLQTLLLGILRVADAAVIVLTAIASYWLRHETFDIPEIYLIAIIFAIVLTLNYMQIARLYIFAHQTQIALQFGRMLMAWSAVMLTLIALAYFTRTSEAFSRAFVIGWSTLSLAGFIIVRLVFILQIDRWRRVGRLSLNIAVVGAGDLGERFIRHIEAAGAGQYRVVGVFDSRQTRIPDSIVGHRVLGTIEDLVVYARSHPLDEIVLALPWRAASNLEEIVKKLKAVPVNVKLCPDHVGWTLATRGFDTLAGIPMMAVLERPLSGWNLILKALEDRLLAAILLVLFSPLLALVALAIRLDSKGPLLFRQTRYGFNNNPITVFKFRTMAHRPDDAAVPQAKRDDPRITRVGRFLRRSSLDELPQLVNVLSGEMSLVGPRPHAVAHNEQYAKIIDDYLTRHRVKPGITGWAQVNGLRGETDTPEKMRRRVQYDLYYIDNWSLWFDVKILLLTPFVGFVNKNAY